MPLFKLLTPEAVQPTRATKQSVGYDITATELTWEGGRQQVIYSTGLALGDVPAGYFVAIYPRSSVGDTNLRLANGVGVIDPDYTGEILLKFDCPLSAAMVISKGNARAYQVGDVIAQAILVPYTVLDETVPTEERGDNGFGSTTKKSKK